MKYEYEDVDVGFDDGMGMVDGEYEEEVELVDRGGLSFSRLEHVAILQQVDRHNSYKQASLFACDNAEEDGSGSGSIGVGVAMAGINGSNPASSSSFIFGGAYAGPPNPLARPPPPPPQQQQPHTTHHLAHMHFLPESDPGMTHHLSNEDHFSGDHDDGEGDSDDANASSVGMGTRNSSSSKATNGKRKASTAVSHDDDHHGKKKRNRAGEASPSTLAPSTKLIESISRPQSSPASLARRER